MVLVLDYKTGYILLLDAFVFTPNHTVSASAATIT